MDGVGGTLKRSADNLVCYGTGIASCDEFMEKLKIACSNISLTQINEENFEEIQSYCNPNVNQIPQVTLMHQATWDRSTLEILYPRKLSCFTCR